MHVLRCLDLWILQVVKLRYAMPFKTIKRQKCLPGNCIPKGQELHGPVRLRIELALEPR